MGAQMQSKLQNILNCYAMMLKLMTILQKRLKFYGETKAFNKHLRNVQSLALPTPRSTFSMKSNASVRQTTFRHLRMCCCVDIGLREWWTNCLQSREHNCAYLMLAGRERNGRNGFTALIM